MCNWFKDKRVAALTKQVDDLSKQVTVLSDQVAQLQAQVKDLDMRPIGDTSVRKWLKEGLEAVRDNDKKKLDTVFLNI
jgi:prefoldin subunit 5